MEVTLSCGPLGDILSGLGGFLGGFLPELPDIVTWLLELLNLATPLS